MRFGFEASLELLKEKKGLLYQYLEKGILWLVFEDSNTFEGVSERPFPNKTAVVEYAKQFR